MADDNKVVSSKGSEDVINTLKKVDNAINKINNGIDRSNNNLSEYTSNFEALNGVLRDYVSLLAEANKNSKIKLNVSGRSVTTSSRDKTTTSNKKETSAFSKASKGLFDMFAPSSIKNISNTAIKMKGLVATAGTTAVVLGAVAAGLAVIGISTVKAQKETIDYSRSLSQLGAQLNNLQAGSLKASSSMRDIKNKWSNFWQDFGEVFEPVLNGVLNLVNKIPGNTSETKKNKYGVQSDISASTRQSGFTLGSANALAGGTYKAALGLSKTSLGAGLQASDIAKSLSNAWLTGSDSAKQFGIVLNDNVLTGWLALNKNIDISNMEITEAQKQAYRYELMLEEIKNVQNGNLNDLSKYVKTWTEAGIVIDKAKNKLFSFDEVINLDAFSSVIPDVTGGLYGVSTDDSKKPTSDTPTPGTSTIEPVIKPVVDPDPVVINVEEPDTVEIPVLEPETVEVEVNVPGIQLISDLAELLNNLPEVETVSVTATVAGLASLMIMAATLGAIPASIAVGILLSITGSDLLNSALEKLQELAKKWTAKLSIEVAGQALLEQVKKAIEEIQSLLSKFNLGGLLGGVGGVASSLVKGFTSKTGTGIIGKWSPSNTSDLDLNLTRLGIKKKTTDGYTTRQIWEASAEHTGYNLNPFHKGTLANSFAKGLGALGLLSIASGVAGAGGAAAAGAGLAGASGAGLAAFKALPAFADGGIGTKEVHGATLFEDNKKEAVIPLESEAGIRYLASAMEMAGSNSNSSGSGDTYEININLSGLNVADSESSWERVGKKIAEVIEVQRQRRGDLAYGGNF